MAERLFSSDSFPILVAHRGDPIHHPENTIAGFVSALEAGADAVEFDVRLTADRIPVVVHDADVGRTTDGSGLVRSMSVREVRALRIRGPGSPGAGVPLLSEALEAIGAVRGGVDIEIKNVAGEPDFEPGGESALEATLDVLDAVGFVGPVLLSSFNPASMRRARALAPTVSTGLLTIDAVRPVDALAVALGEGHSFILPSVSALSAAGQGIVDEAHERGVRVGTWNADDPAGVRRLLDWGVDAIATNDPAMANAARRAWREGSS